MSHLHVPDGLLPAWLVALGWGLAIGLLGLVLRRLRTVELRRRLPRLGFVAALMLVAMSAEVLPLAYHLDLGVVAAVLLGPALGFLAAFVVDASLALVGHGGVTVVGLNALVLGAEIVTGDLVYRLAGRAGLQPPAAAAVATIPSLAVGTSLMLAVALAGGALPEGVPGSGGIRHPWPVIAFVFGAGVLGWLLEAAVTAGVVRYLAAVRPRVLER